MCGRFTLTSPAQVIAEAFAVDPPDGLQARYNVCPGQAVLAVRASADTGRRTVGFLRWGLVPGFARELPRGAPLINARAETAAEKASFRSSFRTRRCLVPADGFFEWRAEGGVKQPYLIRRKTGAPFGIAGLWARWRRGDGPALESCALLTTEPNELLRPIHDRMPVILAEESWERWLDPQVADVGELRALLGHVAGGDLEAFPVSRYVNHPENDDPRCLERAAPRTLFD